MNDSKPLVACYLRLKRKTFWVVRWIEISVDGVLIYKEQKEDKVNKGEYQLLLCKIKEVTTHDGQEIEIESKGGGKIKLAAHVSSEHKKIVQAIQQLKVSKQESNINSQKPSMIGDISPIKSPQPIQQVKPIFKPDPSLATLPTGEVIKPQTMKFMQETQNCILYDVQDNIWHYKQAVKIEKKQGKNSLLDSLNCSILSGKDQYGLTLMLVILFMFTILFSLLFYLLFSVIDSNKFWYSVVIAINLIWLPQVVRPSKTTAKPKSTTLVYSKTLIEVDYNALTYILSKAEYRQLWYPYLKQCTYDQGVMQFTNIYHDNTIEQFHQSIFFQDESIFLVEHQQNNKIIRIFQIKFINEDEMIQLSYYSQIQSNLKHINCQNQINCMRGFIQDQRMHPKSILLEYLQRKQNNESIIITQIDFKQSEMQQQIEQQSTNNTQQQQQQQEQQQQEQIQKEQNEDQIQQIQQIQPDLNLSPEGQKFAKITDEARVQLESYLPLEGWSQQGTSNGFTVYTKQDVSGFTLSRGEGLMPYSIEQIYEIIERVDKRGDYDNLFDSGYMHKKLELEMGIVYQKFKTIKIVVQSRDFVFITRVYKEPECYMVVAKSIEYPEIPPNPKSVRGDCRIAGWQLKKVNGGTYAIFINMVDPKGSIPSSIVQFSAKEQGKSVENIKKVLDKKNKK